MWKFEYVWIYVGFEVAETKDFLLEQLLWIVKFHVGSGALTYTLKEETLM